MLFGSLLRKIAEQSPCDFRHGAVVAKGKRVLAVGHNRPKMHPRIQQLNHICNTRKLGVHAEVAALLRCKDAEGATLHVARLRPNGEYGLSKPCPICLEMCRQLKIKRIVFTNDDGSYEVINMKEEK